MVQHPLDNIIIRANADTQPHDGGKIVLIDRKTGFSLRKKPAPWELWKDIAYYLVFSGVQVRQEGLTYDIHDFDNDRSIQIQIDYQATCLPTHEEDVTMALYDNDTVPSVILENKITGWIRDFTMGWEREFIDNYLDKIKALRDNMETRAQRETALSMKFRLTSNIQLPGSIDIGPLTFPIQVRDYPNALDNKVTGELGVLDQKIAHDRRDKLEAIVEREIKNYMAKQLTLHEYYFLSHEQILAGLKKQLDDVLAPEGRKVERLFIEREQPTFSHNVQEITESVKYHVQERTEPVTIVSTLQMELQNAGQYIAMGAPNLTKWVQRELDNIIPKILFDKRYIDLLLSFQPCEAEIKQQMTTQAEKIGYSLRALISVPNLEQFELLKNFDLEVPDDPDNTLFPTKIDQAEVKLAISVTTRIQNLKDIEIYLNQQQDTKQLMKETILNETKRFLRSVEPEDFYMHFSFSPDGEPGVEQKLIDIITNRLSEEFKATVIKVDLKRLNTEITERLRQLEESPPCEFRIEMEPLTGGEPILFVGEFQVAGVDHNGWYQFQKKRHAIEEIRDHIQTTAQRKLKTFSREHLEFKWYEEQEEIQRATGHIMQQSAAQAFGVAINILNFGRELTEYERKREEIRRKLEQEKLARLEHELEEQQKQDELARELTNQTHESDKAIHQEILNKRKRDIEEDTFDGELSDIEAEIHKRATTDRGKDSRKEHTLLEEEFKVLENSRPQTARSQELLTRVTQSSEKALPNPTPASEVEQESESSFEKKSQADEDIADAEIIKENQPAKSS